VTDARKFGRPGLVVGLVALALYLPSLSNGFAFDDERDIRDNPAIADATGPVGLFLSPYRGAVPAARSPYRPITSLSFWLNWKAGDGGALPFHAVNVLLHVLASVLVVQLLLATTASTGGALAGGLVFAVHPVHVEAVANIVGRADILMTIFCLVGALAFLSRRLPPAARALIVALSYALALGAKENGVVLPGLLLLLLVLRSDDDEVRDRTSVPIRTDLLVLAPTLAVLGGYLLLRESVLGALVHRDTAPYITILGWGERFTTGVANLLHLGRLLVVPTDLIADYGPDVIVPVGLGSARFWAGVVATALSAMLAWTVYRRQRLGAVALGWIALSVLIVSNLVIPIGVWVAERTLYLPSVGVAIGAAALVQSLARHRSDRTRAVWGTAAVLIALGAWKTLDRIPSWRDTETVLRTLAEEHPESFRGQWWLARRLTDLGDLDGGLPWFERAVRTNPNDLGLTLDYARALLMAGRAAEAEALAAPLPPTDPARFIYLAQSKIMAGRTDEAREDVREGLSRFPRDGRLLGQAQELGLATGN
jgi:hypothetical protein